MHSQAPTDNVTDSERCAFLDRPGDPADRGSRLERIEAHVEARVSGGQGQSRLSACDQFVRVLVKKSLHLRFHLLLKPARGLECFLATGGGATHAQGTHQVLAPTQIGAWVNLTSASTQNRMSGGWGGWPHSVHRCWCRPAIGPIRGLRKRAATGSNRCRHPNTGLQVFLECSNCRRRPH